MKKIVLLICLISSLNVMGQKTYQYVKSKELLIAFPDWLADRQNLANALEKSQRKYAPLIQKCRNSLKDSINKYDRIMKSTYSPEQTREFRSKIILSKHSECEQLEIDMREEAKKEAIIHNYYSKILSNLEDSYGRKNVKLIYYAPDEFIKEEAMLKDGNIKNATPEVIQAIKDHIKKYKTLKMASLMKFKS